ncbi:hypothetical protein CsSME_00005392 [Camellia sinensis var. sinensis]
MADNIPHDGGSRGMEGDPEHVPLPPRMADNISHDGGSLGMEGDPKHVPLPPKVRPFDLETYHPEGDSHSIRGYGATSVRKWYMDLPIGVRQIVDEAGFGLFCTRLSRLIASGPLLGALLWIYAYFPTLAPELEVEMPPIMPYSHWYDGRCLRRTRKTFPFFCRYFDTLTICVFAVRRSRGSPRRRCLRVPDTNLLVLGVLSITGLCLRDCSHATFAIHEGYRESLLLEGIHARGGRAVDAPSTRVPPTR